MLKSYIEGNRVMGIGGLNKYLTSDSPYLNSSTSISMLMDPRNLANTPHRAFPYLPFPLEHGRAFAVLIGTVSEMACPLLEAGGGIQGGGISMTCLERCNGWGNPRGGDNQRVGGFF